MKHRFPVTPLLAVCVLAVSLVGCSSTSEEDSASPAGGSSPTSVAPTTPRVSGSADDGGSVTGSSEPSGAPAVEVSKTTPDTSESGTPLPEPQKVAPPPAGSNYVVGYFTDWGIYDRNYLVKNIVTSGSADKLTHILYAFGNVDGGVCKVGDGWADHDKSFTADESLDGTEGGPADLSGKRGNFEQLRELKAAHPGLKVLWSFGGWTWSGGFPEAAADPVTFANSCYDLIHDPRWDGLFDGIDIDWEYPNDCGDSCDTESGFNGYSTLIKALRARFGPDELVTSAISADGSDGGKLEKADYAGAAPYLNFMMPMTYDFFGAWDAKGPTAPQSPLTAWDTMPKPQLDATQTIDKLESLGIPAQKLLLGIAFYGRGWSGVQQAEPGGAATGAAFGKYEAGVNDYKVLVEKCPPTGVVAGTAYAYCGSDWWSYDTPETIKGKMKFVKDRGMAGAFFWELSGDTASGDLIAAIADGLH